MYRKEKIILNLVNPGKIRIFLENFALQTGYM